MAPHALLAVLFVAASASCGGEVGGGAPDASLSFIDARPRPDASPRPDAMVQTDCAEVSDVDALEALSGKVIWVEASEYLSVDHVLDSGSQDLFVVELFGGIAPFATGLVTGNWEISGDQTNYNTCGTCVTIFGDAADEPTTVYVAQSGTLTVTGLDPFFTGTFVPEAGQSSVVFQGYKKVSQGGEDTWQAVPDCTVRAVSAEWDRGIRPDEPGP